MFVSDSILAQASLFQMQVSQQVITLTATKQATILDCIMTVQPKIVLGQAAVAINASTLATKMENFVLLWPTLMALLVLW